MKNTKRFSVFWFNPNPTIGSELQKVRPCVVVSPEIMNDVVDTILIVPLTSTIKSWPFRITLNVLGKKSSAACDQLRVVDKTRLREYIGSLSPTESKEILNILKAIFTY